MIHLKNVLILMMLFSVFAVAQEEAEEPVYGWQKELVGNLNFTQNSFDNWSQGGEDSWSWALELRGSFVNEQEHYSWANSGKLAFGKTKVGSADARKAADEIRVESVYTRKLGIFVNPYASVTAYTQFAEGFKYTEDSSFAVSNFMDPGYFIESIGLGYEPVSNFKTRLGVALKQTITDQYPVPYADDPETAEIETTRNELGIESVTDFSKKLSDIMIFTTKLELFSNTERFDEIDVNWDNLINAKVSKYIVVSFNLKLFYDKDISPKRQLQQTLAVGLSYSFI